jgi:hypothetical protein
MAIPTNPWIASLSVFPADAEALHQSTLREEAVTSAEVAVV